MKTLVRHGLAVCLALTTMCTSLLLVYSSLGGQKEQPAPPQPPAPATGSAQPAADSSPQPRLAAPAAPRQLDGYLGVADHQVTARGPVHLRPSFSPGREARE
nr:alpha-N-acetylgalactosaminide alpha-2,6-sialyltransferase 5-like [Cavia porcellus]